MSDPLKLGISIAIFFSLYVLLFYNYVLSNVLNFIFIFSLLFTSSTQQMSHAFCSIQVVKKKNWNDYQKSITSSE